MLRIYRLGRCLVASLFLIWGYVALAQNHPGIDQFNETADRFDRLVTDARAAGGLPRMSEPATAALLPRLSNARQTLDERGYGPEDIPAIASVLNRTATWLLAYAEHGIGPNLSPDEADIKAGLNSFEYQDEMMPLMSALVDENAQLVLILEKVLLSRGGAGGVSGEDREKWLSLRDGHFRTINNLLVIIALPEIRLPHKAVATETLARNAATYAAELSAAQRLALTTHIKEIRPSFTAGIQAQLDGIVAALSTATCERLCSL